MKNSIDSKPDNKEALDSISIAAFDVDSRIFRTMWHTLVRTPDVVLAGLKGDYTTYLSPIRVIVALFGLQFAIAAIFGAPMTTNIELFLGSLSEEAAEVWLQGNDPIAIDRFLNDWLSLLLWPLSLMSSAPFLILLKLYRPSLSLWGHVIVYLVATNASYIVMLASLPLFPFGDWTMVIGVMGGISAYLWALGWSISRFYSQSYTGTAFRLLGIIAILPITMLLSAAAQFFAADWLLDSHFGLSYFDLIKIASSSGETP